MSPLVLYAVLGIAWAIGEAVRLTRVLRYTFATGPAPVAGLSERDAKARISAVRSGRKLIWQGQAAGWSMRTIKLAFLAAFAVVLVVFAATWIYWVAQRAYRLWRDDRVGSLLLATIIAIVAAVTLAYHHTYPGLFF